MLSNWLEPRGSHSLGRVLVRGEGLKCVATGKRVLLVSVATLVLLSIGARHVAEAVHDSEGFSSSRYTYNADDSCGDGGAATDPISFMFLGNMEDRSTSAQAARHVSHATGWGNTGPADWQPWFDSPQWFETHGECREMSRERASRGNVPRNRYHMRFFNERGGISDFRYITLATPHYEFRSRDPDCRWGFAPPGPGADKHAVVTHGFTLAKRLLKRALRRRFQSRKHYYIYSEFWNNRREFTQCNGNDVGSNGWVPIFLLDGAPEHEGRGSDGHGHPDDEVLPSEAPPISCSAEDVRDQQRYLKRDEGDPELIQYGWVSCFGFNVNASMGGWSYEASNQYRNGLFSDCPGGSGQRGLCIGTSNSTAGGGLTEYGNGQGEFRLVAPPTTKFELAHFRGRYQERERNGEWPNQCLRFGFYPSTSWINLIDTGFSTNEEVDAYYAGTEGDYRVFLLDPMLQRLPGEPRGDVLVFRQFACVPPGGAPPGGESLGDWDAFSRLDTVEAALIDSTPPTNVTASGQLWDLRGNPALPGDIQPGIKWGDTGSLHASALDVGSGLIDGSLYTDTDLDTSEQASGAEPNIPPFKMKVSGESKSVYVRSGDVPCDYNHPQRIQNCETSAGVGQSLNTGLTDMGWNSVCVEAADYVSNRAENCFNVHIDGEARAVAVGIDAESGYARANWNAAGDLDGSQAKTSGVGNELYQYRFRVVPEGETPADYPFPETWIDTYERYSSLLDRLPEGAEVYFQVRTVDKVGNVSAITESQATASTQPILGARDFQTYATGGEKFFTDLTTNLNTGGLLSQKTDLSVSARGPDINLTRTYNSAKNKRGGIFGYGWHSSIETHLLELTDRSVLFDDGQGSLFRFPLTDGSEPCVGGDRRSDRKRLPFSKKKDTFKPLEKKLKYLGEPRGDDPTEPGGGGGGCGGSNPRGGGDGEYGHIPGLQLTLKKEAGTFTLSDTHHNVQSFDSNGKIVSLTDRNGNALTYAYDENDQVEAIRDAAGRDTTLDYDVDGRLKSVTDPAGRTSQYTYTADHLLRSVEDASGKRTCFAYDSDNRLTRTATPKLVPNDCGPISNGDEGLTQGEAVIRYDDEDRVRSLTNERHVAGGNQAYIGGRPIGASTTYEWGAGTGCDLSVCVRGPIWNEPNATIGFELNETGQAIRQRDRDGHVVTKEYDADFNPTQIVTDASAGRLSTTTMSWDHEGHMTSRKEPGHDQPTTYEYQMNDLIRKTLPSGRTTTYSYDQNHNLNQKTAAPQTPAEAVTYYAHDPSTGNLISITDPQGTSTSYGYDASGNRTRVSEPESGAVTAFTLTHDAAGQLTNTTDSLGSQSIFTWSPTGKLIAQADVPGDGSPTHAATLSQDSNDNLVSQADQSSDSSGTSTEVSQTTSYEANTRASDSTFGVSQGGTPSTDVQLDQELANSAGLTEFRRTKDGQSVSLGHSYNYDYHYADTLWTVERPTDENAGFYSYDGDGNLTSVIREESDTVTQSSSFDLANREVSRQFVASGPPSEQIADQTYTYDEDDRLTSVVDTTTPEGTADYTYDDQGRLITDTRDGHTKTYNYDASGNRKFMNEEQGELEYTYDRRGRLIVEKSSWRQRDYSYDEQGNLTETREGPSGPVLATYEWDARSRLIGATTEDGTRLDFTYQDRTNLRTTKKVRNPAGEVVSHIKYGYDSATGLLVSEIELESGSPEVARIYNYDSFGQPISVTVGAGTGVPTFYYNRSPWGDVLALTDVLGTTTAFGSFRYDAFGNTVSQTVSPNNPNPLRWHGAYFDQETGLYYMKNRYYDPMVGRFISPDPARVALSLTQRYVYADNDPVNRAQPTGSRLGEEVFDPNPYERTLSRSGTQPASTDTPKAPDKPWQTCEGSLAHHWGPATPKETMVSLAADESALLDVSGTDPCTESGE